MNLFVLVVVCWPIDTEWHFRIWKRFRDVSACQRWNLLIAPIVSNFFLFEKNRIIRDQRFTRRESERTIDCWVNVCRSFGYSTFLSMIINRWWLWFKYLLRFVCDRIGDRRWWVKRVVVIVAMMQQCGSRCRSTSQQQGERKSRKRREPQNVVVQFNC